MFGATAAKTRLLGSLLNAKPPVDKQPAVWSQQSIVFSHASTETDWRGSPLRACAAHAAGLRGARPDLARSPGGRDARSRGRAGGSRWRARGRTATIPGPAVR